MEPEKMVITGIILVVVVLGLTLGVSVLTFQAPEGSSNDTTLTGIVADRDLLELGLQIPTDWTFEMADGTTLSISELSGKIILVDLMTTLCGACSTQNAYLETVYDNLAGSLVILSLSVDSSETAAMMDDYQSTNGLSWDHGLDEAKFTNYFQVTSIPTLILIDSDGYFRYMHIGLWSDVVITDKVASIM
ncbi:MAG: TlpA family protein disulfide reductase [Candidatus Thorarchaeota archaeon]|nr:TlpA family protein disulfide reductase [Candidatus Thorarchaeota archaeon]